MLHEQFRQALEDGDIDTLLSIWKYQYPGLPLPKTQEQAEIVMHHARTVANTVSFKKRAYSHKWLLERNYPSGLPDELRPQAERLYPRIVETVGISVNLKAEVLRPAAPLIEKVMSDSVLDSYAEGENNPDIIRTRMLDAKKEEMKKLFGTTRLPKS